MLFPQLKQRSDISLHFHSVGISICFNPNLVDNDRPNNLPLFISELKSLSYNTNIVSNLFLSCCTTCSFGI